MGKLVEGTFVSLDGSIANPRNRSLLLRPSRSASASQSSLRA
jgi:hypothetical protein